MKICINIYSNYKQSDDDNYQVWNKEIAADTHTVKSLFNSATGYEVIDIEILAGKENVAFSANEKLRQANLSGIKECHIVLNTHGAAGSSDMSDNVIKDTLKYLSKFDINVTAITALQCNAFKQESIEAAENRLGYKLFDRFGGVSLRPASMKILQEKLNALELEKTQHFVIRGFEKAYDPIRDRSEVIELLSGNTGKTLVVNTREKVCDEEVIRKIRLAINYVRKVNAQPTIKKISEWDLQTNCLAKVFKAMLDDIQNYFEQDSPVVLNETSQQLYAWIKEFAISKNKLTENLDFANYRSFLIQYKEWGKTNSFKTLHDNKRLELLTTYCNHKQPPQNYQYSERDKFFSVKNQHNAFGYSEKAPTTILLSHMDAIGCGFN